MRIITRMAVFVCMVLSVTGVYADAALLEKKPAQVFIQDMVERYGFKRNEVKEALREAKFQPRIIELMNQPYEKKTWDVYRAIFLTSERLDGGIKFWKDNQESLARAEKEFGVPASMIVAILGVETRYGEKQGTYRVLDALTTLAFYYPKRSAYFKRELKEYLLLCKEQKAPVTQYVGSYAGAIGQPQFMPSSYRMYAVDFKQAGSNSYPDLVRENKDVIASIANYFKRHGWKSGEEVVEPARVKGKGYEALQTNSRRANYAYKKLVKSGVTLAEPVKNLPKKAGLIELQVKNDSNVYWLAYPNFYVIMRYNVSPQYALVVHLLSQQLQSRFEAQQA